MDIQKQRAIFQKIYENNFDFENHEQTYFNEKTQCYENEIGEDTTSINIAWSVWQQAQKVAIPEGFVLVKRNLTNAAAHAAKSVDGRLSAFKYSDVWDAMIEAQEQH
jgi:hypothetical protein